MKFHVRVKRPPSINIVSLIDILTLLLIFFIVTTTFKQDQPAVQIKLPKSKSAAASKEADIPIIIHISATNEVFVESTRVPILELGGRIASLREQRPDIQISLKADEKANFGTIIQVLDAFKEAGIENLPAFTSPAPPQ